MNPVIEDDHAIAQAILECRYARNNLRHAEAQLKRVEAFASVDKRTRDGRTYKKALKWVDEAIGRQRRARMALADQITNCDISSNELLVVEPDIALDEGNLEYIGA